MKTDAVLSATLVALLLVAMASLPTIRVGADCPPPIVEPIVGGEVIRVDFTVMGLSVLLLMVVAASVLIALIATKKIVFKMPQL